MESKTSNLLKVLSKRYDKLFAKKHKSQKVLTELESLKLAIQSINVLDVLDPFIDIEKGSIMVDNISEIKKVTTAKLNLKQLEYIPTLELLMLDSWKKQYGGAKSKAFYETSKPETVEEEINNIADSTPKLEIPSEEPIEEEQIENSEEETSKTNETERTE